MTLTAQVRLTSWFLGELKPDHRKIRRFKMTSTQQVAVNQIQWLTGFNLAAHDLGLGHLDVRRTVVPPDGIVPASIHLYRRTYSKVYVELFEAFREQTILTFNLRILEEIPKHPTANELAGILKFTGQFLGLSQFGSKFGFGRFDLLSLDPINPALYLNGNERVPAENSVPIPSRDQATPDKHADDQEGAGGLALQGSRAA